MAFGRIASSGTMLALLVATPAAAEVVSATPAGFEVSRTVTVAASPADAYAALVRVGDWWSGEHSYSGKAANMTLDPRPGGCFCEALANGGGVEHGRVIYADPGKTLRFTGGLGPLQDSAVVGTMTWTITSEGAATRIKQSYAAGGYVPGGADKLAAPVDQVLGEQLSRLKAYLDGGGGGRRRP